MKPGDKDYEKLKRSIAEFGFVEPVVWNERTGFVVGGHQRLKVLLDMGVTEIDCVVLKNPDKVRESWNKLFRGSVNSHQIAVLEEGLKYQPIGISPDQAQFLETRKFQLNEIARIFRVPPHMVGDLEKSSFSNIEQQSLEFVKYTLEPWLMRWEQAMGRRLFTEGEKESYFIRFNVEGLLRGDYESRMNGYAVARQNGWMSANDTRGLENLDRIPAELGGDLYLVNGSMTKLADAGAFAGDAGADTRAAAAAGNRGNGGNGK